MLPRIDNAIHQIPDFFAMHLAVRLGNIDFDHSQRLVNKFKLPYTAVKENLLGLLIKRTRRFKFLGRPIQLRVTDNHLNQVMLRVGFLGGTFEGHPRFNTRGKFADLALLSIRTMERGSDRKSDSQQQETADSHTPRAGRFEIIHATCVPRLGAPDRRAKACRRDSL